MGALFVPRVTWPFVNELPGVENRIDLLYQAVVDGRIGQRWWACNACASKAQMLGLDPQKGMIAPGSDVDIVLYNPHADWTPEAPGARPGSCAGFGCR
ncbi:hypothetical protein [Streptomyces sp. NBC_01298]|uniref:hypothetical protein n=1 Tax=Streptomyces sp. NBC_01298 TaxID=2903817 RepID=UPI003FA37111